MQVRIVSDGTARGTAVLVGDEPVNLATDIEVRVSSGNDVAQATLRLYGTPMDVAAHVQEATLHTNQCSGCGRFYGGYNPKCQTPECRGQIGNVTMRLTDLIGRIRREDPQTWPSQPLTPAEEVMRDAGIAARIKERREAAATQAEFRADVDKGAGDGRCHDGESLVDCPCGNYVWDLSHCIPSLHSSPMAWPCPKCCQVIIVEQDGSYEIGPMLDRNTGAVAQCS